MLRSSAKGRDWFVVGLGTLAFIADLYTVYQMISKEIVFDFWTWQWIISIILVGLLAVGGMFFLHISGSDDAASVIMFIFGVVYTLCSLIIYLKWALSAVEKQLATTDFFGFLALFAALTGAGLIAIAYDRTPKALRFPSYGYATASLAYVVLLVNKYVMKESAFAPWAFAGEMVILLIGIILFIFLYIASAKG